MLIRARQRAVTAVASGRVIVPKRGHSAWVLPNPFEGLWTIGWTGGSWSGFTATYGDFVGNDRGRLGAFASHITSQALFIHGGSPWESVPLFGDWLDWEVTGFAGRHRSPWGGASYGGNVAGFGTFTANNRGESFPLTCWYDVDNALPTAVTSGR